MLQPHDFISRGRQDIHKPTGKDQTGILDHPTKNTPAHACSGDETSATETEGPSSSARPPWCLSHTFSSSLSPLYLPLQKYQAQGGEILCDNTHTHRTTHSSRRRGQIVRDTPEPSRKPRCARDEAGQKKKPVSHAEALGQLYKDSHSHKHTQAPPCCMQSCGTAVGEKKKSVLPLLKMRNIIQGPSFLSNTGGCLYSKPCLDKFGSIRRAEKKIKGNQSTYNFISGVAAAHFR